MKNSFRDYFIRKNKELHELNCFLGNKTKLEKYYDIYDIFKKKEEIICNLRNKSREKYYHHLTNNNQIGFKNKYFTYQYTYERFNGFIDIKKFANKFYGVTDEYISQTYFTNCGMTSVISLISSLCLSNNVQIDLLYEETYFETIKYLYIVNKKSNIKALYIDTIASDFSFDLHEVNLKEYDFVVIDTTCFWGKNFSEMINNIINHNIPCILVRSVTKLDMMATEYSHMGFISFIYNNNMESETFLNVINSCKHLIGVFGSCLIPENFPEFIMNNKINELNKQRLSAVNYNNTYFCELAKSKQLNVILPNHHQFCLIQLGKIQYSLDKLKSKIKNFCKKHRNLYSCHSVSFGFDYIAIDCYQNFLDGTMKIRICLSDIPKELVEIFFDKFYKFLIKNNL